jgi:hypothetical protein
MAREINVDDIEIGGTCSCTSRDHPSEFVPHPQSISSWISVQAWLEQNYREVVILWYAY